jgi:hypothetical protein
VQLTTIASALGTTVGTTLAAISYRQAKVSHLQGTEKRTTGSTRTTTSASATASSSALVSEVDAELATIELLIIHIRNGALGFLVRAISHETETARALRLAITHHNRLPKKKKTPFFNTTRRNP